MRLTGSRHTETSLKAFYFLYFAAAASLLPYLALIYEQRGMVGHRIGILTAIPPLITLFAASFWSGVADATQYHKRLLALSIAGTIVSAVGIFYGNTFLFLFAMVIVFAFFNSPIVPLIDSTTMKFLNGENHRYGSIRLWGALGWGLTAPLIGLLVNRYGLVWPFYGFIIILSAGLLYSFRLPVRTTGASRQYWAGFLELIKNPRWILFLLVVFVTGIGFSLIHNYLFLYMNHLNAGSVMMGLSLMVATGSELIIFAYSGRMLARWGIRNMLILSILALVIRLFAYSFAQVVWIVLVIQLLHGLTFSLLWVSGVAFANRIAAPELGSTAQGIFSGVSMGLAAAVGAIIGGVLYEKKGPFLMYRWSAIGIVILTVIIGLIWRIISNVNRGEK